MIVFYRGGSTIDNSIYSLWLKDAVTSSQAKKLVLKYGSAKNVYELTDYSDNTFITQKSLKNLSCKNLERASDIFEQCQKKNIYILTPDSSDYPPLLKLMSDCPHVIFAKGKIPKWDEYIAIGMVGTRRMTNYGREITDKLSRDLVNSRALIVSGFASGIDSVAARAAVECSAPTVAVLGCGVDVIYPAENKDLYNRVLENGVFISEYPPGTKPDRFNFPQRNKIIVGICHAITVLEAPTKSGAIITADIALKKKKPVFTVPGQINRPSNLGTNMLIKKGATAVFSAQDIISVFPEMSPVCEETTCSHETYSDPIMNILQKGDMDADSLAEAAKISITECNSRCFMLELEGKIQKLPGNFYHLI